MPVDGFAVDVSEHEFGDRGQFALGVAHGRRRVTVNTPEVALSIDQRLAHRERLRHADKRFVYRRVAVRMVFAQHVTDQPCTFLVRRAGAHALVVHRVEDAALDRFQAIANVGQCARDDYAHGVVEVRRSHLLLDADGPNVADVRADYHADFTLKRFADWIVFAGRRFTLRTARENVV